MQSWQKYGKGAKDWFILGPIFCVTNLALLRARATLKENTKMAPKIWNLHKSSSETMVTSPEFELYPHSKQLRPPH